MALFSLILREILGMFVDDEFLALAVLAVIAASAAISAWSPPLAGGVLLVGSLAVVTLSIIKTGRKQ